MTNKKYNPTDLQKDEFINLYLSYLDKKNASKYTKKSYKSYFKLLKTLDWSNPEFITDFLNERYDNKRTFNTAIAIFKAFFNFLNKKNIFFLDTTELLLVSAGLKLKPAYSKSQFIKLEKYLEEFNNKKFSFVFYFLKNNWTRVGEFENINWDFFNNDINAVLIIQAKKNNNERIVKIPKEAQEYWGAWFKKPLSPVRIMHLFSEFKKFVYERDEEFKSKNIQISAHCLRTSGITKAATAGLSAVEISAITGHKTTVAIDKNYIVRNIEKTSSDMDYVNNSDLIDQLDNKVLRAENKELNMQINKLKLHVKELTDALEMFKNIYNLDIEKAQKNTKNTKNKDKNSDEFLEIWKKFIQDSTENKGVENENIN